MDQQFDSDVMHDLMADSPALSADEAFDEGSSFDDAFESEGFDGYDEDGMEADAAVNALDEYDEADEEFDEDAYAAESMNGFEDYGDQFADEEIDAVDAMEAVVADALDADDSDEFLGRLISGVRRVAGAIGRGAGTVGRIAGRTQRIAGQVGRVARGVQGLAGAVAGTGRQPGRRGRPQAGRPAGPAAASGGLPALLQQLLPLLQQHAAQGADELDLFEDLADWFEYEDADEALPILAGVAARAALRPLIRRGASGVGQAVRRQIVRGATQAARNLVNRQGPQAIRAIRPIASSVGRAAARRGLRPAALPGAIRQTTARVTAQPSLVRRLSRSSATPVTAARRRTGVGNLPRRIRLNGPVEIIIRR